MGEAAAVYDAKLYTDSQGISWSGPFGPSLRILYMPMAAHPGCGIYARPEGKLRFRMVPLLDENKAVCKYRCVVKGESGVYDFILTPRFAEGKKSKLEGFTMTTIGFEHSSFKAVFGV